MATAAGGAGCPPPPPPNNNNNNNKSKSPRNGGRRRRNRRQSRNSDSDPELQGATADPSFFLDEDCLEYLPEKFDGNPDALTPFIAQCQVFMEKSSRDFSVDRTRVCFVTSMLHGRAARWATAKLERCNYLMNNYRAFMLELKHVFEDPQRREAAKRKIRRLRQGAGTVSEYAGIFQSVAQDLDWDESSLVDQFLEGLNQQIHQELSRRSEVPTNLNDLIRLCIHIERRLVRLAAEAASRPRDPPRGLGLPLPQSSQSDPTEPVGGARMRLTQEEKERRRKLNLCLYCGNGGHYADNCPAKGNNNRNSPSGNSPAPL
ncbi:zinc finger CCHC domain-containing protein 5 [Cricetulus griseus]|uniref:CCHC-type domain-containing protein n=1 Tax=Cricetulus griseus TaxID=10029 RepID=A0A8C2LQ96_CRIGR|nr:zinc finger CCHC domain-containing protein 5 [Cricetulus griseus]